MEWIFIFYKGASGWTINYFSYTDKLQDMFDTDAAVTIPQLRGIA
jgi:hypothetical protein